MNEPLVVMWVYDPATETMYGQVDRDGQSEIIVTWPLEDALTD